MTNTSPKGVKLKPEKGMNFPDTVLDLSPLTEQDLTDLDFVAVHADINASIAGTSFMVIILTNNPNYESCYF